MRPRTTLPPRSHLSVKGVQVAAAVPILVNIDTGTIGNSPFFKWGIFVLIHPWLIHKLLGVRLSPFQQLWTSTGPALHSLGAVYGFYQQIWWFDHVTHTVSAVCIAALLYTLLQVYNQNTRTWSLPPRLTPVLVLIGVMFIGVSWEWYETKSVVLTVYSHMDTAMDLVFDAVGGVLVCLVGPRYLDDTTESVQAHLHKVAHVNPSVTETQRNNSQTGKTAD